MSVANRYFGGEWLLAPARIWVIGVAKHGPEGHVSQNF